MSSNRRVWKAGSVLLAVLALVPTASAAATSNLETLAKARDWQSIQKMGPQVMPRLAQLYRRSNEADRTSIALVFYNLRWKSEDAKDALMADVHTDNQHLRLQVQWALGRVSDDPRVVDVLLENLQNDGNPLFRDKAACALAYDQIHLSPAQKVRLFEGLVGALDDPKDDVRRAAALALRIHTGQSKGYVVTAPPDQRRQAIERWQRWLSEYKAQL